MRIAKRGSKCISSREGRNGFDFLQLHLVLAVADPEICLRGWGQRPVKLAAQRLFFLTSYNRGRGPGPPGPLDPLLFGLRERLK